MMRRNNPEEPNVPQRRLRSSVPALDLDGREPGPSVPGEGAAPAGTAAVTRLTRADLAQLQLAHALLGQVPETVGHDQSPTVGPRLSGVASGDRRASLETLVSIEMPLSSTSRSQPRGVRPDTGDRRQTLERPISEGSLAGVTNGASTQGRAERHGPPVVSYPSKNSQGFER